MPVLFSLPSVLSRTIRLTAVRWALIVTKKHPIMHGRVALVRRAVLDADFVVQSRSDPSVYLYYLAYNEYWLCVVCKHENGSGFVITTYITDRVKDGAWIWKR